jgi:hypothetical protein
LYLALFLLLLFVNRLTTRLLAAEAETLDELLVALFVLALKVVEEVTTVLNLTEKTMTRAVVLLVSLEVSGESLDLLRENSDLNFARSRVTVMALIFVTDGGFVELHCFYLSFLAFAKFFTS